MYDDDKHSYVIKIITVVILEDKYFYNADNNDDTLRF